MSDVLEYEIDYPTVRALSELRRGDSFFFKGDAYTVASDHMLYTTCFRYRDACVVSVPGTLMVRRVDIVSNVREWTGQAEDPLGDTENDVVFDEDPLLKTGH